MAEMRQFVDYDLDEVNRWMLARGQGILTREWLPRRGWIVPGVACAFLLQTDTLTAQVEPTITNGDASSADRHAALEEIYTAIEATARAIGFRQLLAYTRTPSLVARGLKREATLCAPMCVLIKGLAV